MPELQREFKAILGKSGDPGFKIKCKIRAEEMGLWAEHRSVRSRVQIPAPDDAEQAQHPPIIPVLRRWRWGSRSKLTSQTN